MKQSMKELDNTIAGVLSYLDTIRDEINKTASSCLSTAVPTPTPTLSPNNGSEAKLSIMSKPGSNAVTKNLEDVNCQDRGGRNIP